MNSNIIQKKLEDSKEIKFVARVYRVNKGPNRQHAYFATIRKKASNKLNFREKDALLLKLNKQIFPTVIRKLKTARSRFMLGFTVPYPIGKNLSLNKEIDFKFLKENSKNTNLKEFNNRVNLQKIIPSRSIRKSPIYVFDLNDDILIWIYSKGNKPVILPKFIEINKNDYSLYEFAGAFFCEGFKARKTNKHRDRFSFSNADEEQIEWFLSASEELLSIPKQKWQAQILHPSSKESKNLVKFWSDLGLSPKKIKIQRNSRTSAKHGVCILNIHNSTLAETIFHLMEHIQKKAILSEYSALQFFRGLSRGDIGVSKKNSTIAFSTESKENALYFHRICELLEIPTLKPHNDKRGIRGYWCTNISISHEILTRLIKLNAITHRQRKYSLYKIALNHKKLILYLYLKAIYFGCHTSITSAEFLNLSPITTRIYLRKFVKRGYLARNTKSRRYIYSLTGKGREKLDFYKKLENYIINNKV